MLIAWRQVGLPAETAVAPGTGANRGGFSKEEDTAPFMRNARVLGLLAVIAVIAALAVPPLWSALKPDHRVRPSDAAGAPPTAVNPAPKMGTLPSQPSRTQAEAAEILRRHGYIDISNPAAQPDGSWAAAAAKELNGRKITVIVDRSGNVTERPATSEAGH